LVHIPAEKQGRQGPRCEVRQGYTFKVAKAGRETEERKEAMGVYRRGDVWWYKFRFAGQTVRESSKSESRTIAKEAKHVRRRQLEESWNQIKRRKLPPLFSVAAKEWINTRTGIASSTERSYKLGISHLSGIFGKRLLC
jgi:hypothetical protein